MSYYYCRILVEYGYRTKIWKIEGNAAICIGTLNAKEVDGCYCEASPGELISDAIREQLKKLEPMDEWELYEINRERAQYYPRIARPTIQNVNESPGQNPGMDLNRNFIASTLGQLNVLVRQLGNICQVVHPETATFRTYGHTIRNLLILACTEVETHWRGVLEANGIVKPRFTTNDYIMLLQAMRLDNYSVSFPSYPWLESIKPFGGWSSERPTTSLAWYDAYNAVKHNREGNFERAALSHIFDAITACAIMLVAQFGTKLYGWDTSDSGRFFYFDELPKWSPSDAYVIPYGPREAGQNHAWAPINFPFTQG